MFNTPRTMYYSLYPAFATVSKDNWQIKNSSFVSVKIIKTLRIKQVSACNLAFATGENSLCTAHGQRLTTKSLKLECFVSQSE